MKKTLTAFQQLSSASLALLVNNLSANQDGAVDEWENWEFEAAGLIYNESDRVTAIEGIISAVNEFEQDHFLSYKITLDSLTGASANGAVIQPNPQTFTRPSGNGQYTINKNETPLDDTFKDTRVQLNIQWEEPRENQYRVNYGAHLSREYDYTSIGFNGGMSKDYFKKNTTLAAGISVSIDIIDPEGGRPIPLSSMIIDSGQFSTPEDFQSAFNATRQSSSDQKIVSDLLLGITQIINRQMLVQLNYSWSNADGYLTDPFKLLSVIDSSGITQDYVYESRPSSRTKQSLYLHSKYHFEENALLTNAVLDFSYRYMWDDWGITSDTMDLKIIFPFNNGDSIEPHIRIYSQNAADFYSPFILQTNIPSQYSSADYRIGELEGLTIGLKYIFQIDNTHDFSMRLEFYKQTSSSAGFNAIGVLQNLDITPDVDAVFAQLGYSF